MHKKQWWFLPKIHFFEKYLLKPKNLNNEKKQNDVYVDEL